MKGALIDTKEVKLGLSSARSKIRIADIDGNHEKAPTKAKNISSNSIEWMITNNEIGKLIKNYLFEKKRIELITKINKINVFLKDSKYASRKAKKVTPTGTFEDFEIFEYTEGFFSFEKSLECGIKIRIVFKMGDFALAPHMFILFPFQTVRIYNNVGEISSGECLGSGSYAIWVPTVEAINNVIESLAYASSSHKQDLVKMLES